MLSGKKAEHFKQLLETRIAELNRVLATAEQETRASAARHADPADQAAAEYERQSIVHKSNTARQMLKTLTQALERIRQGSFGKCAACGGDVEPKRLEAIPWGRGTASSVRKQGNRADTPPGRRTTGLREVNCRTFRKRSGCILKASGCL